MLEDLLRIIEETAPLPRRYRSALPGDVAELSRLLTAARGERDNGYLSRPNLLSAYLRYFLPWNVFRLSRLFSFAPDLPVLSDGDAVSDLGSGPLTLPIALWITQPELRKKHLEFRCIDTTGAALDAGKQIFAALAGKTWTIKTIKGPLGIPVYGKKAKLTAALNVFNEVYPLKLVSQLRPGGSSGPEHSAAGKAVALLGSLTAEDGSILVMEPGNPQGGAFIASLRAALLTEGRAPLVPCPHAAECPLPGSPGGRGKAKWCHFAFDTEEAPAALHKLSEAAGIPKERATFSFLLAGQINASAPELKQIQINASNPELKRVQINAALPARDILHVRSMSDPFPVPGTGWGRYGCSEKGLILIAGTKPELDPLKPETLLKLPVPVNAKRDTKTGALMLGLNRSC
ncbi:hypothetical protein AGMMS50230_00080 [Spirochaetia bacterium]|nr:hypothetical protein AGMMS50230_00080 [Spirochaetia bacterium]